MDSFKTTLIFALVAFGLISGNTGKNTVLNFNLIGSILFILLQY